MISGSSVILSTLFIAVLTAEDATSTTPSLRVTIAEVKLNRLSQRGIPRRLAKEALELAGQNGRFTIFSLVDALTRLTGEICWIGDRTELDQKIGRLLSLAA
jgi:hypothetical protein